MKGAHGQKFKKAIFKQNEHILHLQDSFIALQFRESKMLDRLEKAERQIRELEAHLRTVDPGWRGLE